MSFTDLCQVSSLVELPVVCPSGMVMVSYTSRDRYLLRLSIYTLHPKASRVEAFFMDQSFSHL